VGYGDGGAAGDGNGFDEEGGTAGEDNPDVSVLGNTGNEIDGSDLGKDLRGGGGGQNDEMVVGGLESAEGWGGLRSNSFARDDSKPRGGGDGQVGAWESQEEGRMEGLASGSTFGRNEGIGAAGEFGDSSVEAKGGLSAFEGASASEGEQGQYGGQAKEGVEGAVDGSGSGVTPGAAGGLALEDGVGDSRGDGAGAGSGGGGGLGSLSGSINDAGAGIDAGLEGRNVDGDAGLLLSDQLKLRQEQKQRQQEEEQQEEQERLQVKQKLVEQQQQRQRLEEKERVQQELQLMHLHSTQLTVDEQHRANLQNQAGRAGAHYVTEADGEGFMGTPSPPHLLPPAKQEGQSFLGAMYYTAAQSVGGASQLEQMEHPCMHVSFSTHGLSADMVAGLAAAFCLVSGNST